MLIAPGFAQGFPHDSSRPPPSATGQYGLNVRAPFAAPRGFPAALLTVAAAARVKFRFLPTRPGWVGGTALYHPVIAAAQQTFYHPSPPARVPLGGITQGTGN